MTLLLLHAFPLDERMWEPQREAFPDAVAPNLYRLGNSMDAWAEAVLDRVEGRFAVCGASMGGYGALAFARRAPERVIALVLAGARVEADSAERRAGRADTLELIRSQGPKGLWDDMRPKLFPPTASSAMVESARALVLEQDPAGLTAAVEAIRDRPDSTELVTSLGVPVVIAVGEHDPFLSVDEARASAASARDGRLHVFQGTGHLPSVEQPAQFNALLEEVVHDD